MSKVLIVSPDAVPVGETLAAGPGIRYWEFARGLAGRGHEVTLAVPEECFSSDSEEGFLIKPWRRERIGEICRGEECVILPQMNHDFSSYYNSQVRWDLPTVIDLYDPVLIESLSFRSRDNAGIKLASDFLEGVVPLIKRGDFFICANNRQKYYYLGILNALGRINPLTFNEDLLKLVPFGVPGEEARHVKQVLRGKIIGQSDLAILWFSGIYPWFDAVTLIRAMPKVLERLPKARLIIMGGTHPRLHAPVDEYQRTLAEAEKLGLLHENVIVTEWRPYSERVNWYLESDVAVCTYKNTLETLLSHRTRVIDFLWAGLPVVTSQGDEVGVLIESHGCGRAVKVGDVDQLASVLIETLQDEGIRQEMSRRARELARERFSWQTVLKPLDDFCKNPQVAVDRADQFASRTILNAVNSRARNKWYSDLCNLFKREG